jgi:hypothetical protein
MEGKVIADQDRVAAHEQAAAEVAGLRKKGIHCHLEEPAGNARTIDVVRDDAKRVPERREETRS